MNRIEKLLSAGDLRSVGNSEQVVKLVQRNTALFADVIQAMLHDHPGIRMRAADAVEKITRNKPELLKPYKQLLLTKVAPIEQKEVRWHLAQILPRLNLTSRQRNEVYKLMRSFLQDESRIVKTFAMQALADIALQDHAYLAEVRKLIQRLSRQGSPAMQSRGKKLLLVLNRQKGKAGAG